ncbi:MAG: GAP family protein [Solirubrobacterales bacterium]
MSQALLFSLAAALNPTLLTATTVMLLLPNPKRLLLGYLLGAYMTSIALGLVIVFAWQDSGAVDTAENTLSPAADIVLGLILLTVAFALRSGRHETRLSRHKEKRAEKQKKTPRWQKSLSKGRSRDTFVVGALLTLPGASYLAALSEISKQDLSATATVLSVLGSNMVMLAILEIPLLGYALAPDWTRQAIRDFRELLSRHGERILFIGALAMGFALVGRGLGELLI